MTEGQSEALGGIHEQDSDSLSPDEGDAAKKLPSGEFRR